MKFKRRFTKEGIDVYSMFTYEKRSSILRNPDGSVVFEADNIEVPAHWSQMASDILAQKYMRRTGVPQYDENGKPILDKDGKQILGSENSIKQVAHRLAGTWQDWGIKYNYFHTPKDAEIFYDELVYMLINQMGAPNSPQWFNTGLNYAYGIAGRKQGHYYFDEKQDKVVESKDAYSRPQPHACFIQSIEDDLLNEGGIFDLVRREARIFKFGSGTGTNFSNLRGESEPLSGGGKSSGLMSFLKIFDRAAGSIKSGGTTRRAAKMVIVDIDHPDVESFIEWKAKEEEKVAALVTGSRIVKTFLNAILKEALENGTDRNVNKKLNDLIKKALNRGIPLSIILRVLSLVEQGYTQLNFEEYNTHYEGEAYNTVSGQNSNNSIRVTNDFMRAVIEDKTWDLKRRTDGQIHKTVKARDLWQKICLSAWKCADPGLQFHSTINEWHTCPKSGEIKASNPCSEYMFLDDTACNLASLNLMKFFDTEKSRFLVEDFKHAIRIWTVVLEISVLMAQFPSKNMAKLSYDFRTLGLGYANLGTLLMVSGIPYDSPEALAITGAITAIMTGEAYNTSAEMAKELGAFNKYELNKEDMLRVIRNHRRAAYNSPSEEYEGLEIKPMGIDEKYCPDYLLKAAQNIWDKTLENGGKYGFRNAQVTVLAPTGTIGLVMDCDTTGIEPDFAIVKFKKLSGGGYFKIVNQSVHIALKKLKYTAKQIEDIEKYCKGTATLTGCPTINKSKLKEKGFTEKEIKIIESQLESVFDLRFAFNKYILGTDFLKKIGFSEEQISNPNFDLLTALGFSNEEIDKANDYVCGTMMLEGAPHLKEEHLPIFDTANRCGRNGKRYIQYMAHVKIMAAAQPFITGAISKTVNMPAEASVNEIGNVYMDSWKMMLKAIAIYRDGSKLSQPLNTTNYRDLDEVVMLGDENTLDERIGPKEVQEKIIERIVYQPERVRLPKKRKGFVREAYVGGHKVYLRTGEYEDGSLGEIFIDMYKEGASFKGLLNCFAVLASKALQYGVPVEELVDSFVFTRFDPSGVVVGHEAIKYATSILDYVFRSIGYDYLGRTDFVHEKAVDEYPNEKNGIKLVANGPSTKKEIQTENGNKNSSEYEAINFPEQDINNHTVQVTHRNKNGSQYKPSDAKKIGYTGEQCENCGSIRVRRNGACTVCEDCGYTSGCS